MLARDCSTVSTGGGIGPKRLTVTATYTRRATRINLHCCAKRASDREAEPRLTKWAKSWPLINAPPGCASIQQMTISVGVGMGNGKLCG